MPTLKEVADKAKVSITTVSRVVNNSSKVNTETKSRVQQAMQMLKYHPNRVAQRLRGPKGRSKLLGLIIPDIMNPFYSNIVRGIEDTASKKSYSVILFNTDENPNKERKCLEILKSESVDGIIMPPIHKHGKEFEKIISSQIPLVCVDRRLERGQVDTVVVNNLKGAYEATDHLLRLGHQKIGLISSSVKLSSFIERNEGYIRALMDNGIQPDKELMKFTNLKSTEHAREITLELMSGDQRSRPTALFITNNLMTLGAVEAIHDLGLSIPEDVSLIGFDDIAWARTFNITVVSQPGYEMGRRAADLFFQRIDYPNGEPVQVVLEPRLILRKSCMDLRYERTESLA